MNFIYTCIALVIVIFVFDPICPVVCYAIMQAKLMRELNLCKL